MSDEHAKDVSPLRLKRPVPPAPPPSGEGMPPSAMPATIPATIPSQTIPPATIPAAPRPPVLFTTIPSTEPASQAPHFESADGATTIPPPVSLVRRRPSLVAENTGHASGAASGSAPQAPVPEPEPVAPVKLRVGAKPPPPAPVPEPGPGDGLPENLFPDQDLVPLVPLSSLSAPPTPLPGGRPPGTALIGGLPPPAAASPYTLSSANAPLMPMSTVNTRPPMAMSGLQAPAAPTAEPAKPAPTVKSPTPRRDLMIFLLVFVVLAAVGAGAYVFLTKPGAPTAALANVKQQLEKAAEMPGKAIDNAKESMSGARGSEQERIDSAIDGNELPEKRGIGALSPAELEARLKEENSKTDKTAGSAPVTGNTKKTDKTQTLVVPSRPPVQALPNKVTPGAIEPSPDAPGGDAQPAPAASPRFVRYAEGLSVSGVFQGTPARALVDGRLVREGEVIEPNLGISFVGTDVKTKHLILEETSGARLRVKY